MKRKLKQLAARLPQRWQQELKRRYFGGQIRGHTFRTSEPEYELLPGMLSMGDWVLDIGANIGHYTMRFSELVGEGGRVIAFEPVPQTFELLTANACQGSFRNVTLLNAAASDSTNLAGMAITKFEDTGLDNFYTAQLSRSQPGTTLNVLCFAVDSLLLSTKVRLVKIDAEGHELSVLKGMQRLIERDRPTLIVEDTVPEVLGFLEGFAYLAEKIPGSSNRIFRPIGPATVQTPAMALPAG